jgi:flagellar hook-associated protein 1 FlgK
MSFGTLGIGASGLSAAQRAMEVTAHNIANVNTDGYSRQRAELTTTNPRVGTVGRSGTGMFGTGVQVSDLVRIRNLLTDGAFRAETATEGSWTVRSDFLARAEQVLGPVDGGTTEALSSFWSAWDQLSLFPDSLAARRGVVEAGNLLARWVSTGAANVDQLGRDVRADMTQTVEEVNRLAEQVAKLNASIFDMLNASNAPNDLMDERDRLLDRIASLTGGSVRHQPDGTVDVMVGSHSLVDGERVDRMSMGGMTPLTVVWTADGTVVKPSGRMGGLAALANADLPAIRAELDAIAVGLRDAINAAHAAGFDQDGNPGGSFFVGSDAATLAVDAALGTRQVAAARTAAGAPNDGGNALAVAGLRSTAAVGSETVGDALSALAGRIGSMAAGATSNARASSAVTASLVRERAEVSSVSLDEELTNMVRFQRAYEASARVLTAVDEMLDKLVNHTGLVGR